MRHWSFEVQHGVLSTLPNSLKRHAEEQSSDGASSFFVAEGGTLLNEPDEQKVTRILPRPDSASVVAAMSDAVGWVFDCFDTELDSDFRFNYLKVSFVNLSPQRTSETSRSGKMSTNHPDLSQAEAVSADRMLHQLVTTIRIFFSHVRAAVEIDGWETETYSCDWVSLLLTKG